MISRRSTYFVFQGLLTAVLMLLFLYQYPSTEGWLPRFLVLTIPLVISLIFLKLIPEEVLGTWWFQIGLFVGDALVASLTLHWTTPESDLYLLYVLIIYGTALTRRLSTSFFIGIVSSILYLLSTWRPDVGFPAETGFWLRVHFLWISTALMAILSRDTQQAQQDQETRYREKMVQFERMAALGQLAGEVAHRIKGPLTTILVNAEVLSNRHAKTPELSRDLEQIKTEVIRCRDILKDLLDLGRIEEIDLSEIDLRDPVQSAIQAIRPELEKHAIRWSFVGIESPMIVHADPSLLHEAITAILQNAADSIRKADASHKKSKSKISSGGRILIRLRHNSSAWKRLLRRPEHYEVLIEDNGSGIEPGHLEQVFHPFFTTKGEQGHGLGLSAALRILQKHGGAIDASSPGAGHGATFTLSLPHHDERSRPSRRRKPRGLG